MCIIVHKPADKSISEATIRECFFRNPHGAGISFVENKKLVVIKGIRTGNRLVEEVMARMDKELVIHCRVASHGMVQDDENCHPFAINVREKDGVPAFQFSVSHNGRLEWGHDENRSDTHTFVDQMLTPMFENHPWILDCEYGEIMLSRTISHNNRLNKMVIMRYDVAEDKTDVYIINEKEGNMKDGVWYSNYSYIPEPPKVHHSSFFPARGVASPSQGASGAAPNELDQYCFWCIPDANGWFWSYVWDAWVNAITGTIIREMKHRASPKYMANPEYKPKELNNICRLFPMEITTLMADIKQHIRNMDDAQTLHLEPEPPAASLPHLNSQEKSLLCKKAYDILKWAGVKKDKIKKLSAEEKSKELREWILVLFSNEPEGLEVQGMKNEELDAWIIKKIKEGGLSIEKVEALFVIKEKQTERKQLMTSEEPMGY